MPYDAIVIGGGVVGISIAYHLVCAGARTLLLDREDVGRATDAGAGILAPETNGRSPEEWIALGLVAAEYYPALIARLREEQGGDTGYAVCGLLAVAVTDDEIEPFAEARRRIFERQQRRGLPAPEDLHDIAPEAARALFPPLAHVRHALYFRHAARVDGRLLAQAMRRAAEARGLEARRISAGQLVLDDRAAAGVVADGERFTAPAIAIAGGAWSQRFGDQLGTHIPVEPQRGQIIHLDLPDTDTETWPVVMAYRSHYMVAWPDRRVVVGATRETGAGFQPHTTAAGVHEVLGEALRVAPGLGTAQIREIRVGLRPATPDGLPVLGAVPAARNVYLATGHGPSGLLLGPYSGKLVADLMLGRPAEADLSPFSVARFAVSEKRES